MITPTEGREVVNPVTFATDIVAEVRLYEHMYYIDDLPACVAVYPEPTCKHRVSLPEGEHRVYASVWDCHYGYVQTPTIYFTVRNGKTYVPLLTR